MSQIISHVHETDIQQIGLSHARTYPQECHQQNGKSSQPHQNQWYQLLLMDFGEKAEPQPLFNEHFAIVLRSGLVIFRQSSERQSQITWRS